MNNKLLFYTFPCLIIVLTFRISFRYFAQGKYHETFIRCSDNDDIGRTELVSNYARARAAIVSLLGE